MSKLPFKPGQLLRLREHHTWSDAKERNFKSGDVVLLVAIHFSRLSDDKWCWIETLRDGVYSESRCSIDYLKDAWEAVS